VVGLSTDRVVRRPSRRVRRRRILFAVLAVVLVSGGWLGDSLEPALTAQGGGSVAARLAEWGRFHHLGWLVDELERIQYDLHPPRVGGTLKGGVPPVGTPAAPSPAGHTRASSAVLPAPAPITPFALPALRGEGTWRTLALVKGQPALRVAYLRPDAVHTSYLTGVFWMNPRLLRFQLHPGTEVPGGTGWAVPPVLAHTGLGALVATFNSGFTLTDNRGGFYEDGRTAKPLVTGEASLVMFRDGTATVGAWNQQVRMAPSVVAVRQNLDLMINNGKIAPDIGVNDTPTWGYTLGNTYDVFRSGIGVTASGALVYVAGNALSTTTLARILQRAGAVRAMELDINPEWVSAMWYSHPSPGSAVPHLLTQDEMPSPYRYFSVSARDFVSVYARS
jgi:hypothetical protein